MSDEAFIDIVAADGGTKIAAERDLIAGRCQMSWLGQPIDQALAIVGPGPA